MHPVFADYMQAYGVGGLRGANLGMLSNLARVYWYTVGFRSDQAVGRLRIYGSGIASSYTETFFALDDASPNRIRFDVERVMRFDRIDDFQETYFVIDGFEDLLNLAEISISDRSTSASTGSLSSSRATSCRRRSRSPAGPASIIRPKSAPDDRGRSQSSQGGERHDLPEPNGPGDGSRWQSWPRRSPGPSPRTGQISCSWT